MRTPRWEIKKSKDDKPYFVYVAGNGEVVATSETYESKQACRIGINSIRNGSNVAPIIDGTILELEVEAEVVEPIGETPLTLAKREYFKKFNKRVHHSWDLEKIMSKISESDK